MRKDIFSLLMLFLTISLSAEISLNNIGRIETPDLKSSAEYYFKNGEYYIDVDGNSLIGNSLFQIKNGYITLTVEHENIPSWLRVYTQDELQIFYSEHKKIINLSLSSNRDFAIFYDMEYLQVLDIKTLQLIAYESSVQFAVNNSGIPVFVDKKSKIHFQNRMFTVNEKIRSVHFLDEVPIIITENSIYKIGSQLLKTNAFSNEIYEAKVIEDMLYLVIKESSTFQLLKFNKLGNSEKITEINFDKNSSRIHEPIFAPLNYEAPDHPFPIGNSYAEIQQYGDMIYLHPGVDFLGYDYQEVYAVHDGFVKAVLTTGGAPYWRVAIANEDLDSETQGYLYAHLNESSITVNVGDQVSAGDLLGTLYPWNYYDFTHIHFARVFCTGSQWFGDWWTTENNLLDVINMQDTIPPTFQNAVSDQRFAFVDDSGCYLEPYNLSGQFDIISKCYDIANSDWKIDLHDLSYTLSQVNNPDSILFQKFAYVYDFDLDTYFSGTIDNMILNTIYSRDETCYSIGNYDEREFYHVITNSNGDSLITQDDAAEIFDSTQFPDDIYYFKVTARDASLNSTTDSMLVIFNNEIDWSEEDEVPNVSTYELSNYPNPFNPRTIISFNIPRDVENAELIIFNAKGQKVKKFSVICKQKSVIWNGNDDNDNPVSSGIYYYTLSLDGKTAQTKKMLLLK